MGATAGTTVAPTLAAFSDTATVTAATSSRTVPAPSSISCTNGAPFSGVVYILWPLAEDVPDAYQLILEVYASDPGSPIISTPVANVVKPVDGKVVAEISRGSLPGSGDYHVAVHGSLDGTTWRSLDNATLGIRAGSLRWDLSCA